MNNISKLKYVFILSILFILLCAATVKAQSWGACCASGQSDPSYTCTNGQCVPSDGCGPTAAAVCPTCCPAGQTNPHTDCKNPCTGETETLNTCGVNATCPANHKPTCNCGGTPTCAPDGTWTCPNQHAACVVDNNGNTCKCVNGQGADQCKTLGAQCACCTPGQTADCQCGGQKICVTDASGSPVWTECLTHTDAQCVNGASVCTCDQTLGDDSCQLGQSTACTTVGATQNCPAGGVSTCQLSGCGPAWSACPAPYCPSGVITTYTACNVQGQCVPSANSDGSNCLTSANTLSGNPKCTQCNYGTQQCVVGFYDHTNCALGADPKCQNTANQTACNSQGVCIQSPVSDGLGCTVGNNSKCTMCDYGTQQCVPGFYDHTDCSLGSDPKCAVPPPTQTACNSQGVCVLSTVSDGSGCTVGDNSKCTQCIFGTCQCVAGFYDHTDCALGTDSKCCKPPVTACNAAGQCVASTVDDGSGCVIADNTSTGNSKCSPTCPLNYTECNAAGQCIASDVSDGSGCVVGDNSKCTQCNYNTQQCVPGFFDGSGCTLGADSKCAVQAKYTACNTALQICYQSPISDGLGCSVSGNNVSTHNLKCINKCSPCPKLTSCNDNGVCVQSFYSDGSNCVIGDNSKCTHCDYNAQQCIKGFYDGVGCTLGADPKCSTQGQHTACNSDGQCYVTTTPDGSNCLVSANTASGNSGCTHCDYNAQQCVIGLFDGTKCGVGSDPKCANGCNPKTACNSAGQCYVTTGNPDGSNCLVSNNTATGNPLCTQCNNAQQCVSGLFDGKGCKLGADPLCANGCTPGDTKTCTCGDIIVCQPDGTWPPCPNQHAQCVANNTGNVCTCVNGAGTDLCQVIGAQCNCCTPDQTADCDCPGSTKSCVFTPGANGSAGNWDWTACSTHADSQIVNGASICKCDPTPGTDACQLGQPSSCPLLDATKSCPDGGLSICQMEDNNNTGEGLAWSVCKLSNCNQQKTSCNAQGQCAASSTSDGSNCVVGDDSKCTKCVCNGSGQGQCESGLFDGTGCILGDSSTCAAFCSKPQFPACNSKGQCVLSTASDGSNCSMANNTTSGNPACVGCNWNTYECVYGFL